MAEEPEDIDQFLYGDEANFIQQMAINEAGQEESAMQATDEQPKDEGEVEAAVSAKEEGEEDEEDEDLEIVLDGSSGPTKRGLTQVSMNSDATKAASSGNAIGTAAKASVDVDAPGMLNGEVIYNIELDSLPEKPWRMPGADITDYFNYGFTEQTWREYCLKQRTIRDEFGTQKKIAVFDGSVPAVPGIPVPPFAPPPGAVGRPPMLPPGMPPFPFPIPPGGPLPFPPFMFPGMPPPPAPLPVKSESPATTTTDKERVDEDEGRDREKDRDRSDRDYRSSSRRDRRSPTRHRSRSRSKDRDTKRRR